MGFSEALFHSAQKLGHFRGERRTVFLYVESRVRKGMFSPMKRIMLVLIVLCLSFVFTTTCSAETHEEMVESQLQELSQKYGVQCRDIAEMPEGIPVVEYESVEEFEKDLIKYKDYLKKEEAKIRKSENRVSKEDLNSVSIAECQSVYQVASSKCRNGYQVKSSWLGLPYLPPVKLNVGVSYTFYGKYFCSCKSITSWTTGFQFPIGFGWEQKHASYKFLDGRRTLAVTVYGTIDYYIIVKGVGKLFSFNYNKYFEFRP